LGVILLALITCYLQRDMNIQKPLLQLKQSNCSHLTEKSGLSQIQSLVSARPARFYYRIKLLFNRVGGWGEREGEKEGAEERGEG